MITFNLTEENMQNLTIQSDSNIYVNGILVNQKIENDEMSDVIDVDDHGWINQFSPMRPEWKGQMNKLIEEAKSELRLKYPIANILIDRLPQYFVLPKSVITNDISEKDVVKRSLAHAFSKLTAMGYMGFTKWHITIIGALYVSKTEYEKIIPPQKGSPYIHPTMEQKMKVNALPFDSSMKFRNPWISASGRVPNHAIISDPISFPKLYIEEITRMVERYDGYELSLDV